MVHESKLQAPVIINESTTPRTLETSYAPYVRTNRSEAINDMNRMMAAFKQKYGLNCEGFIDELPGRKFIAKVVPTQNLSIASISI